MKKDRPSRPLAATFRDVEQLLRDEPKISAAQVAFRLGIRKQTAQIIVAGLRREELKLRAQPIAGDSVTITLSTDEVLPKALWIVLVKHLAGWKCQHCGRSPEGSPTDSLHAHHVDLDDTNHRLSNGLALCLNCHATYHAARRARRFPNSERAA